MANRKRLFFDIETSYNIGSFFQCGYNLRISHFNIHKERAVICVCYKWEHSPKKYYFKWDENQCDKKLLKEFIKVLDTADEIVAHNGDRFDIKWLRTRCFKHKLPMFPEYTSIDTFKEAKKYFNFNSNSLDYIGKFSNVGGKTDTGLKLWDDIILRKSKSAMVKMVNYCHNDVAKLEGVYNRMKPYIKHKHNYGDNKANCPECNSSKMGVRAYKISSSGVKYVSLQCKDCGKYNKVNYNAYLKNIK